MQMEPTEAYEVLCYVPARSLPYNQPGTCYTLVALPKEDPTAGEQSVLLPGSVASRVRFLFVFPRLPLLSTFAELLSLREFLDGMRPGHGPDVHRLVWRPVWDSGEGVLGCVREPGVKGPWPED